MTRSFSLSLALIITAFVLGSSSIFASSSVADDVYYHVFVRSFRDSNGDRQGDLKGVQEQLGYIKRLGATAILLSPVFESPLYHNYFAASFDDVDPAYGSDEDLVTLIKEAHRLGLKIMLDMEVQYVTDEHPWFRASYRNPHSPYGSHVYYNDSANADPDTGFLCFRFLPSYDGVNVPLFTVNFNHPPVHAEMLRIFSRWVDPNGDGRFDDGVDGFRLDHMMDDLDNKGKVTGMLARFWQPLLGRLRQQNPSLVFVGEQSDWHFGSDLLTGGGADAVFAFPLAFAMRALDKFRIKDSIEDHIRRLPAGKNLFAFLENHDVDRFATLVDARAEYLRMGAVLNLCLLGTPIIYYGQELGATGKRLDLQNDGNDIPVREAHLWRRDWQAEGMATWYAETGPWWDSASVLNPRFDSVEEQELNPDSLLLFYRKLNAFRREHAALRSGTVHIIDNSSRSVISFSREKEGEQIVILMNPEPLEESISIDVNGDYLDLITGELTSVESSIAMQSLSIRILLRRR